MTYAWEVLSTVTACSKCYINVYIQEHFKQPFLRFQSPFTCSVFQFELSLSSISAFFCSVVRVKIKCCGDQLLTLKTAEKGRKNIKYLFCLFHVSYTTGWPHNKWAEVFLYSIPQLINEERMIEVEICGCDTTFTSFLLLEQRGM